MSDFQIGLLHTDLQPYFDAFGPRVQYLNMPEEMGSGFACLKTSIPAGVSIPLHAHPDPELLLVYEGSLEFFRSVGEDQPQWGVARPGDVVSVPPNLKHTFRNTSQTTVEAMLITTSSIYNFFREISKPYIPGQPAEMPTAEDMQRLVALCQKYNYWLASPEENAKAGLAPVAAQR